MADYKEKFDDLHRAAKRKAKELDEKLNVTGKLEPLILSPAEFDALIRRDDEKYKKLVADIGVKIDK